MQPSLDPTTLGAILDPLRATNNAIAACYPGESAERQPVHTVYGGAHLFRANTAAKLGELALRSLDTYAPDAGAFANAIGLTGDETEQVLIYERVRNKLEREPVEDFRIDFEDGYGNRPDDEEDASAVAAAQALAEGLAAGTLPFFSGIRIKPFSGELQRRSIRTLDLFVTTLFETTGGQLPENFVITFPKVMDVAQIKAFIEILRRLEAALGLATPLRVELMIETTQSILDANGVCPMSAFVEACEGRCLAAHFGVYDYTAGCSITAQHQTLDHPACDFARHAMQVALGGTGVWLSDGATNVLPVAPHRAQRGPAAHRAPGGKNARVVHNAWRLHFEHVRRSLQLGYYQGWDLNPAQLPTRYAAVFSFFRESLGQASERLHNFIAVAAQATLVGDVFDDAATGQGLLNFFLRGMNCGAISEEEAESTGLTLEELRGRSFVKVLAGRRA